MADSPAAEDPAAQQFPRDEFDRPPVSLLGKEVFGLGQQAAFEPFGLPFAGPLHGQAVDIPAVLGSLVPGVGAGMAGFGGNPSQGDEDFAFQPVLRRTEHALAELAHAEPFAVGPDADLLDRAAQAAGSAGLRCLVSYRALAGLAEDTREGQPPQTQIEAISAILDRLQAAGS